LNTQFGQRCFFPLGFCAAPDADFPAPSSCFVAEGGSIVAEDSGDATALKKSMVFRIKSWCRK